MVLLGTTVMLSQSESAGKSQHIDYSTIGGPSVGKGLPTEPDLWSTGSKSSKTP